MSRNVAKRVVVPPAVEEAVEDEVFRGDDNSKPVRYSLMVSKSLDDRLEAERARRECSMSELLRQLLLAALPGGESDDRARVRDRLMSPEAEWPEWVMAGLTEYRRLSGLSAESIARTIVSKHLAEELNTYRAEVERLRASMSQPKPAQSTKDTKP